MQHQLEVENLPQWIHNISLSNAVTESIGENFERIIDITLDNLTKAQGNYCLLLKITVQVQLKENAKKTISFLLKTQNGKDDVMSNFYKKLELLSKEEMMYQKILPRFEHLYKEAGKSIKFTPRAFTFDADIGYDYVLLEDLSIRKYQHGNRTLGLDLVHMQEGLKKLAEFHAASACYVEHFGMYGNQYTQSIYKDENKAWLKEFYLSKGFLTQVKQMKNGKQFYEKLLAIDEHLIDHLLEMEKVNPREFNVLNHGDYWVNNILFQHDAFGNIKDTLLIDFQVGKYGSPANDLYYFILSSADPSIKLTKFECMVKFYYDHLIDNLKVLNYHRPIPKLRNIHSSLLNHGIIAYLVLSKVLPMVIYEDIKDISEQKAKPTTMYNNPKYVQAVEEILPWLENRGALDWI